MEIEPPKCVMVIAEELPPGLAVNAAAVLAVTVGRLVPSVVGPEATDGSGQTHAGLISITLPILKAQSAVIRQIKMKAEQTGGLIIVDLTEPAQTARTYDDYLAQIAKTPAEELEYRGIALYGAKGSINKLTGNLPLLR
jgi:hypothetical protein